jgi:hypothetical protein
LKLALSQDAQRIFEPLVKKYGEDHFLRPEGLWLTTIRAALRLMWDEKRLPNHYPDDVLLGLAILVTDYIQSPLPPAEKTELVEDVSLWLNENWKVRRGFKKSPLRTVIGYRKLFMNHWQLIDYLLILLDEEFDSL